MAIGSMVTGICSIFFFWIFGSIVGPVALILGIASLRRIKNSNGYLTGNGMAIAGIITGAIGTLILLVGLAFLGIAVGVSSGGNG